jgi:adenylate kinase
VLNLHFSVKTQVQRGEKPRSHKPKPRLIQLNLNAQAIPQEEHKPKLITTTIHPNSLMKRVILITGTPCTGKTTTAKQLATKLNAQYINLTEYAKTNQLTLGEDKQRKTTIINEEKMQQKLTQTIEASTNAIIIIDGHYAAAVTPTNLTTNVFVLRRNPKELKQHMTQCGFEGTKLWENLSAEILDTCLIEAIQTHPNKVCEIDATGKTVQETVAEIMDVLEKRKKCYSGIVDWIGMLEREGTTDQYLKA